MRSFWPRVNRANRKRRRQSSPRSNARRARFEQLEERRLLTAMPSGANVRDLGEFMLGTILVTPVFFESDGSTTQYPSTEDWDPNLIAETKAKLSEGVDWWVDTLAAQNSVHSLEFIFDYTYADNPVSTKYEPINGSSNGYLNWGGDFLRHVGYSNTSSLSFAEDILDFNQSQRETHGTNWAFTIFVANSENDANDSWATGPFTRAFAFAEEKLIVLPSGRPASSTAHETGHMFWALDEYQSAGASVDDSRGYYNTHNLNAWDSDGERVDSIMDRSAGVPGTLLENAYAAHTSSPSSLAMVGWQDSDGDGIFDVLDVPHSLLGSGYYNANNGTYHFRGSSSAQTLPNLNPRTTGATSGSQQNDITINKIWQAQYRVDGGPWQTLSNVYDSYNANLNLTFPVPANFQAVEIRTVDKSTVDTGVGVTSAEGEFIGGPDNPSSTSASGINGFVRHDADDNGSLESTETLGIPGWTVQLVDQSGQPLNLMDGVEPDDYPSDFTHLNIVNPNVTLSAIGAGVREDTVLSRSAGGSTGSRVFAHYLSGGQVWTEWSHTDRRLKIEFDSEVAAVSIDAVANGYNDYGRLEIYDANDNLLARYTTPTLSTGQVDTMMLARVEGDIKYAIAGGHTGNGVRLDNLLFGAATSAITDSRGAFSIPYLPDDDYEVELVPRAGFEITTSAKQDVTLVAAAKNVDFGVVLTEPVSWQNPINKFDVTGEGAIAPNDVLALVNDINANGARQLPAIPTPPPYLDVNGDGSISPIDALLVVSYINNHVNQEGESFAAPSGASGGANSSPEGEHAALNDPINEFVADSASLAAFGHSQQTLESGSRWTPKNIERRDSQPKRQTRREVVPPQRSPTPISHVEANVVRESSSPLDDGLDEILTDIADEVAVGWRRGYDKMS